MVCSPAFHRELSGVERTQFLSSPRRVLVLLFHLSLGLPESLPFSFFDQNLYITSCISHLQHTLHPLLIVPGKGTNDEFLITISPVCCDCLTRKSKYAPQHRFQSVFFSCFDRLFHTHRWLNPLFKLGSCLGR